MKRYTFLVIYLLILILFQSGNCLAERLAEVNIHGIEGRLYENVVANLIIFKRQGESDLTRRKIEQLHANAPGEIKKSLEPFGYYRVKVAGELTEEENGFQAKYTIETGDPVLISAVIISFSEELGEDLDVKSFVEQFPQQKGDVLDHSLYREGKTKILRRLYRRGYVTASFEKSRIKVNPAKGEAEINLIIDSGPRYRFGKTVFEQDLLDESLLTGYLNYEEGEPYSFERLQQLQQILYKTNFFGQVTVRGDVENAEGVHIPVVVTLSEPEFFNRYSFGVGYATDDGLRGTLGWDNRLFNKYGHSVSAKVKYAQRKEGLEFVYGVPVFDPRYDRVLLGATYNDESWEDTDTRYFRGGISFEHAGRRIKYSGGLELRHETFKVGSTSGDAFLPIPHLGWSIAYGDDLIDTTHGLFLSVNMKGGTELLLGDINFLQGVVTGKIITTPFEGLRLIARGSVGSTLVDSFDDLPPSLRFYAGGDQSVRGFDFRELASSNDDGVVTGGKHLLFGSIEAEKTIYDNWSLATFLDVGKGINSFSEDLGKGAGVGVRYRLPFGQIRLDVATALSEDGNPIRLHLTVGGDL